MSEEIRQAAEEYVKKFAVQDGLTAQLRHNAFEQGAKWAIEESIKSNKIFLPKIEIKDLYVVQEGRERSKPS